jgi:uncharacterized protein
MDKKDFYVLPDIISLDKWLLFSTNSSALIKVSDIIGKYFLLIKAGVSHNDAIKHLSKDSNKDVKKLLSEVLESKEIFPKSPVFPDFKKEGLEVIWLHVSHTCNANCKYCYASKGKYFYKEDEKDIYMNEDVAKAAVNFLFEFSNGKKKLGIQFFGGEPLMSFNVIRKTVEYANKIAQSKKVKISYGITTNFYLATKEIIDFLNHNDFSVLISIDGDNFIQKFMRPPQSDNSFEFLWKNLKYAYFTFKNPRKIFVRSTITSFYPFPYEISKYFYNNTPIRNISISIVSSNDKKLVLDEENKIIYAIQNQRLADLYVKSLYKNDWFNVINFTSYIKMIYDANGGYKCNMGNASVNIDPKGDVYLCQWLIGNDKFKLGNINSVNKIDFLKGIRNNKYLHEINVMRKPFCKDCWARHLCGGGCMGRAFTYYNNHLHIDNSICWYTKLNIITAIEIISILQHKKLLNKVVKFSYEKERSNYE